MFLGESKAGRPVGENGRGTQYQLSLYAPSHLIPMLDALAEQRQLSPTVVRLLDAHFEARTGESSLMDLQQQEQELKEAIRPLQEALERVQLQISHVLARQQGEERALHAEKRLREEIEARLTHLGDYEPSREQWLTWWTAPSIAALVKIVGTREAEGILKDLAGVEL